MLDRAGGGKVLVEGRLCDVRLLPWVWVAWFVWVVFEGVLFMLWLAGGIFGVGVWCWCVVMEVCEKSLPLGCLWCVLLSG